MWKLKSSKAFRDTLSQETDFKVNLSKVSSLQVDILQMDAVFVNKSLLLLENSFTINIRRDDSTRFSHNKQTVMTVYMIVWKT